LHVCFARDLARFVDFLRPATNADDICQETWAAAMKALPRFRFDASPRVWLFGIAKRKVFDAGRRRRRAPLTPMDERTEFLAGFPLGIRPETPTRRLARQERASVLERALAAWRPADRELLELRYVCDLKPREIVAVLGLGESPNTVSQRLLRLTKRLREQIAKDDVVAGIGSA
jgi:RNA polymerase sigma factor (sigma-70 family)